MEQEIVTTSAALTALDKQLGRWLQDTLQPLDRMLIRAESDLNKPVGKFATVRLDTINPVDSLNYVFKDSENNYLTGMNMEVTFTVTFYRGTPIEVMSELQEVFHKFRKPEAHYKYLGQFPYLGYKSCSTPIKMSVPVDSQEWETRGRIHVTFTMQTVEKDILDTVPIEYVDYTVDDRTNA